MEVMSMPVTTPEWLAKHGGEVRPAAEGTGCMIYFDGQPQYFVLLRPTGGKFGCEVTQTVNGKRLESGATYAAAADALKGGLEDLRKALGW
jgi:hypothetical protein